MSRTKKVISAVTAILLVLSLSFFVLISHTSAWLYQANESTGTFTFGEFDASQAFDGGTAPNSYTYSESYDISFKAATRFADADEILFDDCVHVIHVTATNKGKINADVFANVVNNSDNIGLRYCFISTDTPITTSYKAAIQSKLSANENPSKVDVSAYSAIQNETVYETYNTSATDALRYLNSRPDNIAPGESKNLYVIFWVEYGDLINFYDGEDSSAFDRDTSGVRNVMTLTNYSVTVSFTASQEDYLETAALEIRNVFSDESASAVTTATLTVGGNPFVGNYIIIDTDGSNYAHSTVNGNIQIKHNQVAVIETSELTGKTFAVTASASGYTAAVNPASGTLSESGNSVAIIQTAD